MRSSWHSNECSGSVKVGSSLNNLATIFSSKNVSSPWVVLVNFIANYLWDTNLAFPSDMIDVTSKCIKHVTVVYSVTFKTPEVNVT